MKREILFRGKLSHSNEWVYGNLIIANNGNPYIISQIVFEPDGHHLIIDSDDPFWVDENTVGQFTGLTDKSGVKIFEGDVIAFEQIRNFKKEFILKAEMKWEERENNNHGWTQYSPSTEIVVIGNIHDNTEILK